MVDESTLEQDFRDLLREKELAVFALAPGDMPLAEDIEKALAATDENVRASFGHPPVVFLLSGWLASADKDVYARIRALGRALASAETFALWLFTPESSAEDIAAYAPEPLYITGRLLSAGIPAFDVSQLSCMSAGSPSSELRRAWVDLLSGIAPGPATLSAWRHDIRGKLLAVVRNYLQAGEDALEEFATAERTAVTMGAWRSLIQTEPYCTQHGAVVEPAQQLIASLVAYAGADPSSRPSIRVEMQQHADALAAALEESKSGQDKHG